MKKLKVKYFRTGKKYDRLKKVEYFETFDEMAVSIHEWEAIDPDYYCTYSAVYEKK